MNATPLLPYLVVNLEDQARGYKKIMLNSCVHKICPGPEVIKLHAQLSMKFTMLINVKMSTIVDILTFISMINTLSDSLKARSDFQHFSFFMSS